MPRIHRKTASKERRKQMRELMASAKVREVVVRGTPYLAPVVRCPDPMECTPLERSKISLLRGSDLPRSEME